MDTAPGSMDVVTNPTCTRALIAAETNRYQVSVALTRSEVREAQRLRYHVFAEEIGAQLSSPEPGIDCDAFDPYCDHLLIRDRASDAVVGTYRILTPAGARAAGSFYSATEFDLTRILRCGRSLVEIGRACVHPDHRDGRVIALLWAGLFSYILARPFDCVIGCASIGVGDNARRAASICNHLTREYLSPSEWRVVPYRPFPLEGEEPFTDESVPPLIKAYLRLGARVCGAPAWDRDFGTADVLMMLPVATMNPRYTASLLRRARRCRS
jgi:putative hemolysin